MKNTDFLNSHRIDQVGIEDRKARITARSIKKESKTFEIKRRKPSGLQVLNL